VTASGAHELVTGDQDLLVLKRFESARIITPRQFWEEKQKI
jgi:predicted nucleic acid-binding protein